MSQDYRELSIDDKFAKSIHRLRIYRPFYSAIYEALKRVENKDIETMGVSTDKMVYNPDFVDSLGFSELMFIQLHEVAHVALMHVARCGDKKQSIWNIACDLYVNRLLAEEFSVTPGKENVSELVKFPEDGLYCSSIDLDTDFAEKIYEHFINQIESQINNGATEKVTISYRGSYRPYLDEQMHWEIFKQDVKLKYVNSYGYDLDYDGKDIIDDGKCQTELENETKQILSDAKFRYEMSNGGSNQVGSGRGSLYEKVNDILKSKIDWVKILRRYCMKMKSSDLSFNNPDKRMFYQKAIYPGQSVDSDYLLRGVKVGVDCSGSISKEDYKYFRGQIQSLLKSFKLDAELIYWDSEVEVCEKFTDFMEYNKIGIIGGGGTNVSCLFEYFDSKKCKIKPYVSVILTDGYLPINFDKKSWQRKYKDTIWVLTKQHNKNFKTPFGKVVPVKYD